MLINVLFKYSIIVFFSLFQSLRLAHPIAWWPSVCWLCLNGAIRITSFSGLSDRYCPRSFILPIIHLNVPKRVGRYLLGETRCVLAEVMVWADGWAMYYVHMLCGPERLKQQSSHKVLHHPCLLFLFLLSWIPCPCITHDDTITIWLLNLPLFLALWDVLEEVNANCFRASCLSWVIGKSFWWTNEEDTCRQTLKLLSELRQRVSVCLLKSTCFWC